MLPARLQQKLDTRASQGALRELRLSALAVDFCSNDYLGIARGHLLAHDPDLSGGSTGSRLLAGNYPLLSIVEAEMAAFHQAPAALVYNSGYDANVGLLSSILQKEDTILYDSLSHASIRDGIRLSFARAFSFAHNDVEDLEKKITTAARGDGHLYVVTETLFSMDGDFCPLPDLVAVCRRHGAYLIVDEAHATGIVGAQGEGLVQHEGFADAVFARIHTFGKALGCHGAVVLGSAGLKQYLINFSRSLIYTTALPPVSAGLIRKAYGVFPGMTEERTRLNALCERFQALELPYARLRSETPIQAVIVPGNEEVRRVAGALQQAGLDVRPILYPTVPRGTERLRIVLHAFNTPEEVELLGRHLTNTAKNN
jgi:8-amino-7-oxononanoate synthase